MKLRHILRLLVTVIAVVCFQSSTAESSSWVVENHKNFVLRKYTPLVVRLLDAIVDRVKNTGRKPSGRLPKMGGHRPPTKMPTRRKMRITTRTRRPPIRPVDCCSISRKSMDCSCAVDNCQCDTSARFYDGCIRITDSKLDFDDQCAPTFDIVPGAYRCDSELDQDPEAFPGAHHRMSIECWCNGRGDCLCGNDQQRMFNCTSESIDWARQDDGGQCQC